MRIQFYVSSGLEQCRKACAEHKGDVYIPKLLGVPGENQPKIFSASFNPETEIDQIATFKESYYDAELIGDYDVADPSDLVVEQEFNYA